MRAQRTSPPFATTLLATTLLAAALLAAPAALFAAGGAPTQTPANLSQTPAEEADEHYNKGLELRDEAWELEKTAASGAEAGKLDPKVEKKFRQAIREQTEATRLNPQHYQAYSSLGYALRRVGDYEASLKAYDRSLELAPRYAEAIEYRGEAYLGLGRVDDAKQAYLDLVPLNRELAGNLLGAMKTWVESRRQAPGGVDTATLESFSRWVAQRSELAEKSAALAPPGQARW